MNNADTVVLVHGAWHDSRDRRVHRHRTQQRQKRGHQPRDQARRPRRLRVPQRYEPAPTHTLRHDSSSPRTPPHRSTLKTRQRPAAQARPGIPLHQAGHLARARDHHGHRHQQVRQGRNPSVGPRPPQAHPPLLLARPRRRTAPGGGHVDSAEGRAPVEGPRCPAGVVMVLQDRCDPGRRVPIPAGQAPAHRPPRTTDPTYASIDLAQCRAIRAVSTATCTGPAATTAVSCGPVTWPPCSACAPAPPRPSQAQRPLGHMIRDHTCYEPIPPTAPATA